MLRYFGELFNSKVCLSVRLTACDNCAYKVRFDASSIPGSFFNLMYTLFLILQQEFEDKNITHEAKAILKCVAELCASNKKNWPLSHLIDIFKGMNSHLYLLIII